MLFPRVAFRVQWNRDDANAPRGPRNSEQLGRIFESKRHPAPFPEPQSGQIDGGGFDLFDKLFEIYFAQNFPLLVAAQ